MGWGVVPATHEPIPFCKTRQFYASHTGGAIGASSVLLIYPRNDESTRGQNVPVRGTVVAMIVNLQNVGLNQTALEIANLFDRVNSSEL
jgi:serine beta-lactamase-like protein LACTB